MGQRLGGPEALLEERNGFALLSLQSWATGSGVGHGLWISDASGIHHERVPVVGSRRMQRFSGGTVSRKSTMSLSRVCTGTSRSKKASMS